MNFLCVAETVYHSSGVFSNLSSSWSSKPPLAVKYRFEPGSIDEPCGPKSLCSALERLLAWEKKLYQEVKVNYFSLSLSNQFQYSILINCFCYLNLNSNFILKIILL